jgi:hypothetical protein
MPRDGVKTNEGFIASREKDHVGGDFRELCVIRLLRTQAVIMSLDNSSGKW